MKKPRVVATYVPLRAKTLEGINVAGALRAMRATKISMLIVDAFLADFPPGMKQHARKRRQSWISIACKTILDETRNEPL